MRGFISVLLPIAFLALASICAQGAEATVKHQNHDHKSHKKHHKKHHKHHKAKNASVEVVKATDASNTSNATVVNVEATKIGHPSGVSAPVHMMAKKTEAQQESEASTIMSKMKKLENEISAKEHYGKSKTYRGKLEVNGPLPADFDERFAQAVAQATGSDPQESTVVETSPLNDDVVEVVFESSSDVVKAVEDQAADPDSKLANGPLHEFLVADGTIADSHGGGVGSGGDSVTGSDMPTTPVQDTGIDVDTEMPYGELEPFGREDTAQELTEQSVKESDEMVDQLERAEVAEEKRAVFRALTRLRGAAITSFDGIARSQTGNIDEYNKVHKWRRTHPLHHLADEESDITKWAFPDNADF